MLSDAKALASRICAAVQSESIPHETSPYGYVTVSIGVAWSENKSSENPLYIQADKALYAAKSLGRNSVYIDNEGHASS